MDIYKGHVIYAKNKDDLTIVENGYIIVDQGKVVDVVTSLPKDLQNGSIVSNYGNRLIIPAFVDMHIHPPQFRNRGLCLDIPLIDWLFKCTFPEEAKFADIEYARQIYGRVIKALWRAGNLRSFNYTTIHKDATKLLMDMFIESGMGAYVGKMNMDINAPDYIIQSTEQSLAETEEIIIEYKNKSNLVRPLITPRFVPACSPKLMTGLGLLAQKHQTPVMSHLSEEIEEIKIVKNMYPSFPTYASIYDYFGLLGQTPTIMSHCVFSTDQEIALLKHNKVYVAHSPSSNLNLGSGMMPARKFLNAGVDVGLGCDVSGGGEISIRRIIVDAIAVSKMIWVYSNKTLPPLDIVEAFYLATKGGGSFIGDIGSFEKGYEFDALVIDDQNLNPDFFSIYERFQRFFYLGTDENILDRYVSGKRITEPLFDL